MKKMLLIIILALVAKDVDAQEVFLICYEVPGQNPVCQQVDSTHPFPVRPQ